MINYPRKEHELEDGLFRSAGSEGPLFGVVVGVVLFSRIFKDRVKPGSLRDGDLLALPRGSRRTLPPAGLAVFSSLR